MKIIKILLSLLLLFQDKLEALVKASLAYKNDSASVQTLWDMVKDRMFSLTDRHKELGLAPKVFISVLLFIHYILCFDAIKRSRKKNA